MLQESMSLEGGEFNYCLTSPSQSVNPPQPISRKVKYTGKNGCPTQHERLPFKVGYILTIHKIFIDRNSSTVEFKEFPNKLFNTLMFIDI